MIIFNTVIARYFLEGQTVSRKCNTVFPVFMYVVTYGLCFNAVYRQNYEQEAREVIHRNFTGLPMDTMICSGKKSKKKKQNK